MLCSGQRNGPHRMVGKTADGGARKTKQPPRGSLTSAAALTDVTKDLQRQYKTMERDRKANTDESQAVIRKQK